MELQTEDRLPRREVEVAEKREPEQQICMATIGARDVDADGRPVAVEGVRGLH